MRKIDIVTEGRIGTALWKNSIPQKYKQYPIIGQGATSIVLDKGDGNVLMLTRDEMKRDWLINGLGIGEWIDGFDARHEKSRAIGEMPVYVIQLPKMFPLSAKNKTAIRHAIKRYYEIVTHPKRDYKLLQQMGDYLEKHPDGLFSQLISFLQDYDPGQYHPDFLMRNFMQDGDGNIVLTDPIVSANLLKELWDIRNQRYKEQDRRW